jgi:hypothetical protein
MNPMAIIPSNTAASCKRLIISSRFSSMTYSEPEALLARQHSLKDKLGASSALANELQGKGQAKLNLLILIGDTMSVREFLAKDGKNFAFRLG